MFMVPAGVEAISFDIWKTLLSGNKAFTRPRLKLIFELLGYPHTDVEALRAAYLVADKHFNLQAEIDGHDYGLKDRIEMMLTALGIDTSPSEEWVTETQLAVGKLRTRPEYMPMVIEPDIHTTLLALREQGYRLALLSNTGIDNELVMQLVLKQLGLWDYFNVAVFSSTDGRAKPNPDLFRATASLLNAEPTQVLHVGDNVNADYRAHEAGLHAVVYAPDGIEGYPSIRSMKELLVHS